MKLSVSVRSSLLLCALVFSASGPLFARRCRIGLIPNGDINECSNCHNNPNGAGPRTPFGEDVNPLVQDARCAEFWGPKLAAMDSDDDGRTNGEELGDPLGLWTEGDPSPGDPEEISNPGEFDEFPFSEIRLSTTAIDFGQVTIGNPTTRSFEIRNTGTAVLELTDVALHETSSADFVITAGEGAGSIAPAEFRTVVVEFTPSAPSIESGTVRIESDDDENPSLSLSLAGEGVDRAVPDIHSTPESLEFSSVFVGESVEMSVVISNVGTAELQITSVDLDESTDPALELTTNVGTTVLSPDETLEAGVRFTPDSQGEFSGSLVIQSDDPDEPILQVSLAASSPGLLVHDFRRSDANGDGAPDVSDAVFLLSFLFAGGVAPSCDKSADSNDSGGLDVSDAIYHLDNLFVGGPAPPPPLSDCAGDPTPDDLTCDAYEPCEP